MVSQNQKKTKTVSSPAVVPEVVAPVVVASAVVETPVVVAPVVETPVVAPAKKTAAKKAKAPEVAVAPAVVVPEVAPATETVAPKKGRKSAKTVADASVTVAPEVAVTPEVPASAPKRTRKPKAPAVAESKPATATTDAIVVDEEETEGKTRSFKVQLPNEQEFSGRFTGLTPYQAANKALSKFFRNNENKNILNNQVMFSIKESSRGSKRVVYTYRGSRIKLETPITYTIKSVAGEDRVITKQYKNQLVKVKKSASAQEETVAVANA